MEHARVVQQPVLLTNGLMHLLMTLRSRSEIKIAQMKKMHYHYLLRVSSSVDQEFFWNDLLGMGGSRNRKDNVSSKNNHTLTETFKSIHFETFEELAAMYDADLKLWKKATKQWTPRQAGEVTMFDLFMAADTHVSE
jgi:hypothetical protein